MRISSTTGFARRLQCCARTARSCWRARSPKAGHGSVDHDAIARAAIRDIGYTDSDEPFHSDGVDIVDMLSSQSLEIAKAVVNNQDQGAATRASCSATPATRPRSSCRAHLLAHKLARQLADDRRAGKHAWLRPDSKTQVTVRYEGNTPVAVTHVVVSTQHAASASIRDRRLRAPRPRAAPLGAWNRDGIEFVINPSGASCSAVLADCGVTGRKIIVDTYGGAGATAAERSAAGRLEGRSQRRLLAAS